MPRGFARFNSDRSGPGIIRQRSAGPCSEIGVHKDELGTNRPGGGLLGSTIAPTEGSADGGRLRQPPLDGRAYRVTLRADRRDVAHK